MEGHILEIGYNKQDYGYRRKSENYTHWIAMFGDYEFQAYAYFTEDKECDKVYDTGVIKLEHPTEFNILMNIFRQNYK